MSSHPKRRGIVLGGLAGAGALLVGWGLLPPRSRLGSPAALPAEGGEVGLNGWIKIGTDGQVHLAMPRAEMGQGVHTALAMLVAEELDVALARVRIVEAGPERLYGNVAMFVAALPLHPDELEPGRETGLATAGRWVIAKLARELGIHATGGSTSVADAWDVLRQAAATARAQLVGAASLQWRLPADELIVRDGVVRHEASGQHAHFGALARAAAATPPGAVQPKKREDWRLIGTPAPRIDLAAKTDGSAVFGIDVRLPGQVYAVVRHCPMLGGGPGRVQADAALALPGVERVVRLGAVAGATAAVAVVARSTWHALRGARALEIEWQAPPAGVLDSATILDELEARARAALDAGTGLAFHRRGDAHAAMASAARRIEAVYRAPYLAHATMEPINCTARVADARVEVWVSTQVPSIARALAAQAAGVDEAAVTLHVTYLGGGFGRRLDAEFVAQAVRIALETGGRPVQLVWPREEDIGHDFYRPAGAAALRAGLDARGLPVALQVASAGDAVTPRWLERGLPLLATRIDLPDKTTAEGLFDQAYAIPNQRLAHVATHSGVPVGYWRSVGHSHNAFFHECFIDEIAHAAGRDPVALRLELLRDHPRHAAVLRLAARQAGWPGHGQARALPPGRARGVALHESFGSIVAEVLEVSLDGQGRPKVHWVVVAADVGTVVNPGIVAQQMESGVLFALAAALRGRIDIEASVVRQRNFPEVPVVTLAETPRIDTYLVPSTRPPAGVGEPGTPPLAPALANALFALTGRRRRELPLAP